MFGYFFSPNNESQNVNMELVLDQKAYLEEINRSLRCVGDNLRRRKTTIDVKYFKILLQNDVCHVVLLNK